MMPFFVLQGAAGRTRCQWPAMVLEFPAPHIAVLRPNPSMVRARRISVITTSIPAVVAALVAVTVACGPHHKGVIEAKLAVMIVTFLAAMSLSLLMFRLMAGRTKCVTFDRRQGMVYKEARRLEPVWQGGIRLRDISAIELAPASSRGGIARWELSLVSSNRRDIRASLVTDASLDALRANAAELSRFLSIPFTDRSSA